MAVKNNILLSDNSYGGKYVTTDNKNSNFVISSDVSAIVAYNEAKKKGVKSPVLIYVPERDIVNIL